MNWWVRRIKKSVKFELYWALAYLNFYSQWMHFHFYFWFLVGIPIGIASSAIGLKTCVITTATKKCKSLIKKKKKHDKIVLLAKSKLNSKEVLISKAWINSKISHDEFVLIDNVLKEFYNMKKEIKDSNGKWKFKLYVKQCYLIIWSEEKIQKVKTQMLQRL